MRDYHWSDCATHNEPAYPNGECDCGYAKAKEKWWTYLSYMSFYWGRHIRYFLINKLHKKIHFK